MSFGQATRSAGLARMQAFLPRAGTVYARGRNRDQGAGRRETVSELSPWLRHRLLTEQELVAAVLACHGPQKAEKFIQEICWRSYWKGWLQQRPGVWRDYCRARDAALGRQPEREDAYARAIAGNTGIAGFDDWARELVATGYLHNHARMSFASIWIFTLGLPWELGADFFHRHLIDGDAACNTLSWRWVAGLHTPGKHYLAEADKIRACSEGRFHPVGQLREMAEPLPAEARHAAQPLEPAGNAVQDLPTALLLSDEDLHPESWPLPEGLLLRCALLVDGSAQRSPLPTGSRVRVFSDAAMEDAATRTSGRWGLPCRRVAAEHLAEAVREAGCRQLVGVMPAVGSLRDALEPALARARRQQALHCAWFYRPWDAVFWPKATRGYFALKARIPEALRALDLPV